MTSEEKTENMFTNCISVVLYPNNQDIDSIFLTNYISSNNVLTDSVFNQTWYLLPFKYP